MSAEAVWILAERLSREHIAQVYSNDAVLIESVRMFTAHGLSRGEAVILVVTPSHRDLLLHRLRADAFDVLGLQHNGQLILADAGELLSSFMLNGMPDATLFRMSIGGVVERVKPKGSNRKVRIFGEMVDLLWKGNLPAAIRVEELWNELIDAYDVSLFCAYSTSEADDRFPQTLCALHSHIIPIAIVESSEDAIVGRTLDQKIVSWNRGAERVYGYTPDEAIGQPTSILMPPGHQDEVPAVIERIRRGEQVDHYETKRLRKDGTVIDVSVSVSPIKTRHGEIVGASAVARDITERKQVEDARLQVVVLEESQATRRLLLERVFETQEEERRRIARELHDEAGQLMATLLVGLRALEDSRTLDEAKAHAHRLRGIASQAMDEVGRLARGLHPAILDDHGLGVALRRYVADYEKIHDIAVDVTLNELDTIDLPPAVQLGVYRILQEALTNVARHSGAKAVSILFAPSAAALETTVTDDGCGFETDAANANSPSHLGLQSIRERAAMLGGTVSFRSDVTGTTILLHIPLQQPDPGAPKSPEGL
jgi:two-component system sensor histidine kinase UhpB